MSSKDYSKNRRLVFIPGGPWISGRYLDYYLQYLPLNLNAERYTLFNHEKQYNPQRNSKLPDLLDDLNNYLKKFQDEEVVLVGHSYGAWLALLISAYINSVNKVILVNMPWSTVRPDKFEREISNFSDKITTNNEFSNYFKKISHLYFKDYSEEKFNYLFTESYMIGNEQLLLDEKKLESLIEQVSRRKSQIATIVGSDDLLLSDSSKSFNKSKHRIIQGAGHFPMIEKPEEFTKSIISLLD